MMKVLICSTDSGRIDFLNSSIHDFFGKGIDISSIQSFSSLKSSALNFDLVISDTVLANQKSIDSLIELECKAPIIFFGENKDFNFRIFELFVLDFIQNPIQTEELSRAFKKMKNILETSRFRASKPEYKKRFLAKIGNRLSLIPSENISCFYAENGITFLMESGSNQKFMVEHTLSDLENELLDPDRFYRINRSIIVNLDNLVEMKPFQNGRLLLSLKSKIDDSLVVARDKVNSFKAWVDR